MKCLIVFILGVVVGTVGPTGVANLALNGLDSLQTMSRSAAVR